MIKKMFVLTVLLLATWVALAAAANEPSTYATAKLGTLKVVDAVLISSTAADMRAFWLDSKVACSVSRKLAVKAEIYVSSVSGSGKPRHIVRSGSFATQNCSEGGPSMGFTITAKKAGSACPNGSWKAANYEFITTATEPKKGLTAIADLSWEKRGKC